ncbi:hypothetical protein [Caulobacter sp. S45]|uniref:hypothetical protein n=1 Tax=Caulobacter sp. S45 TaxID=1641861 RepID=UPI00131DAE4E|nr:hypothetical protein [Caulobacter sp. S45]
MISAREKSAHYEALQKEPTIAHLNSYNRHQCLLHLPFDFSTRPIDEKEEILAWIQRNILAGVTDYRIYHNERMRRPFGLILDTATIKEQIEFRSDPSINRKFISGRHYASDILSNEVTEFISFKTNTITPYGYVRGSRWGAATAKMNFRNLGILFGALAASPEGEIKGLGISSELLCMGLLVFPAIWNWYVHWQEARRGFFTASEEHMMREAAGLCSVPGGWLYQVPSVAENMKPIPGLVSQADIQDAKSDWPAACDKLARYALLRAKEINRIARIHRDPFEAILPILLADRPVAEYKKISDEIVSYMDDPFLDEMSYAKLVRSLLIIRLGLHLGFRQKNLRQLLLCEPGERPTPERRLAELGRGELRWNKGDHTWEVFVPTSAFKNSRSTFFGGQPYRVTLPDVSNLYLYMDIYVKSARSVIMNHRPSAAEFFITANQFNTAASAYGMANFYQAWRRIVQRFGIFNPYTQRGAIEGLLPHGPHSVRDVLATHVLKETGSFEQAGFAIQDTPGMIAKHYGRFLAGEKAAMVAKILNRVWMEQPG